MPFLGLNIAKTSRLPLTAAEGAVTIAAMCHEWIQEGGPTPLWVVPLWVVPRFATSTSVSSSVVNQCKAFSNTQ